MRIGCAHNETPAFTDYFVSWGFICYMQMSRPGPAHGPLADAMYTDLNAALANGTGLAATADGQCIAPATITTPVDGHANTPLEKKNGLELIDAKSAHAALKEAFDRFIDMHDTEDERSSRFCFCTRCLCPGGACCRQVKGALICRGCCDCCCRCVVSKRVLQMAFCFLLLAALIILFVASGTLGSLK